jgi:hypothetical protein
MPETTPLTSKLRASRTDDGGAAAILIINTTEGPVKFTSRVSPDDAEKLRQAVDKWVHAGHPHPAKAAISKRPPREEAPALMGDVGDTSAVANDAIMGLALRRLNKRVPTEYKPFLASAASSALGQAPYNQDPAHMTMALPVSAAQLRPSRSTQSLKPGKSQLGDIAFHQVNKAFRGRNPGVGDVGDISFHKVNRAFRGRNPGVGEAPYNQDPAHMTMALPVSAAQLRPSRSTQSLKPGKSQLGVGDISFHKVNKDFRGRMPSVGEVYNEDPALMTMALPVSAAQLRPSRSTQSLKPGKSQLGDIAFMHEEDPFKPTEDAINFYDDEEHDPADELSRWVPGPLGVKQSMEEAAIISGSEGGPSTQDVSEAKSAVISRYKKAKPGELQAVKYEGLSPRGRIQVRVKTTGGEKVYEVLRAPGGHLITSMSGASAPAADPDDVKAAKSALVSRYQRTKPGTLQAVRYESTSPVTGRMRFLVRTTEGIKGYEVSKSPAGFTFTTMSGDEVGLLKKFRRRIGKGVRKVGKGVRKVGKGIRKVAKQIGKMTGKGWASFKAGVGKLGGFLNIKKKLKAMRLKAARTLATRRANKLIWTASKGKSRVATASQVTAQMPWAFGKIQAAGGKKADAKLLQLGKILQKGQAVEQGKISGIGSFARYELLAPGDTRNPGHPTMEGAVVGEIIWSNMWNPFYWLELAIRGSTKKAEESGEAPAELPEGEPGEGGEGEGGEGEGEGEGEEGESESEGDNGEGSSGKSGHGRKVWKALKAAGISLERGSQWPNNVWQRAKRIAFQILGESRGRRTLIKISRHRNIKVQHRDGQWRVGVWHEVGGRHPKA